MENWQPTSKNGSLFNVVVLAILLIVVLGYIIAESQWGLIWFLAIGLAIEAYFIVLAVRSRY